MTSAADTARRWAETWQRCWEAGEVEPIVELYADDAHFDGHPFRDAYHGREGVRTYVTDAFGDESEVRAWFGEPIATGDRAAVQWWAALREAGEEVTLVGTSLLRFDGAGLVTEQHDTWHMNLGRREPPSGWGR